MMKDEKACGCCEGTAILTPLSTANRPGLDALIYRAGSHATFLETMKARLSNLCLGSEAECRQESDGHRSAWPYPLQSLTTRQANDPAIALLDAWATVADVLTFYQERIANEGYLLTATERRSILELARLVGYRLRPGVAASVYLAFSLEDGTEVEIPAGTRAQSLPGPGELPQSFETGEPLQARAEWNELKPRMSRSQVMTVATHTVYLKGLGVNLKPNDPVLVVASTEDGEADPQFRRVYQIEPEPKEDRIKVLLVGELNVDGLTQLLGTTPPSVIDMTQPPAPENPSPEDGDSDVPTTGLTLSWGFGEGVDASSFTYNVDFGTTDPPPNIAQDITETSYSVTEELMSGTEYHWRITVKVDGCPTEGPPWHFTTAGTPSGDDSGDVSYEALGKQDEGNDIHSMSANTEKIRENAAQAANSLVEQIWGRLIYLPQFLTNPDWPEDRLEMVIRYFLDPLTEAKNILTNLAQIDNPCRDFSEVIAWLGDEAEGRGLLGELNNVIDQLDLRRAVPSIPGRMFSGQFIDPGKVVELINHRWEGEKIKFLDPTREDVIEVGEPGLRRLLDNLERVLGNKLLDVNTEEDEKILAVHQQIQQVRDLQDVFEILGITGQISGKKEELKSLDEWIKELNSKLWDTITRKESIATTVPRLVPPLLKTPALPPANALRLERTIRETFASGADIAPRVLTTFRRQLQDTFYQALAEAEATPLSPLQGFEVLRAKAAPFGTKAPLKPVHNSQGVVIGHKEWLLFGVGVHISFKRNTSTNYGSPIRVQFLLTQDAETRHAECGITLDADNLEDRCYLRGRRVDVSVVNLDSNDDTKKITITGLGSVPIEIYGGRFQTIKIGDYEHTFGVYETRLNTINGDLVTITTTRPSGGHPKLLIDDISMQLPSNMRRILALDAEYNQIRQGGWVVIEWPDDEERPKLPEDGPDDKPDLLFRRIKKVETVSKPGYGEVTQLDLDKPWLHEDDRSLALLRKAVIYTQGERAALAEESITDDIGRNAITRGKAIKLDRLYDGLEAGRWLIVSGERTDIPGTSGVRGSELVMLAGVIQKVEQTTDDEQKSEGDDPSTEKDRPGSKTKTIIQLAKDGLNYTYKRDTVTIYGNVVKATHGETRQEVLGSGDGSQARQSFTLKQTPLTYLAAATPAGARSTLKLYVNDILWHEAESLIWLNADERGYISRTDDQDQTTLIFGDGQYGARLPTGIENVKAEYRTGIGKGGNVGAERIKLLASRPLGVKEVINPLPATGGANRERRNQARRNAPLAVMALDRLVSVQDYADFARAYAGIGKAHAVRLTDGQRELILLTVAGADDIPITPHSDLYQNLRQALHRFGAPNRLVKVAPRELMLLIISANVRLLPDYRWESVAPDIRTALLETFSFDRRQLGQDVLLGEVVSTIQHVSGVAYVDVDILDGISENIPPDELTNLADELREPKERITVEVGQIQTTHLVKRSNETLSSIAQRYNITEVELRQLNPDVENPNPEEVKKWIGKELVIPRQIRPAQLAYLSPDVPDMLILMERV